MLEHLAVIFSAATGPLVAKGKGVDLFGVLVLGIVAAVGGGTLRDVLLNEPVFWIQDERFLLSAVLAAGVAFYMAPAIVRHERWFLIPDALGLAFVTMLGTAKADRLGHTAGICLIMGVMTGVAGGMVRDVLLGEVPLIFRPNIHLYATAAAAGSCAYLLVSRLGPLEPGTAMLLGACVVLVLRFAAIRWRWHLPVFMDDPPAHK